MLALAMEESAVKDFMGKLLREGIFNCFDVRNIEIATTIRISIDGLLAEDEKATMSLPEGSVAGGSPAKQRGLGQSPIENEKKLSSWEDLRPLVYTIIKSSSKPKLIKIVFFHQEPQSIHNNAMAVSLIMNYESDNITFTTATTQKEFVLDKSLDISWDEWVRGFFLQKGIPVHDRH